MAACFAFMRADQTLIFASRKGADWHISDTPTDSGPRGRNLTVFVDGRDVLGLKVHLPARNEKEAYKAAPFAIEDDIAESVEAVHVALSAPLSTEASTRTINVVAATAMVQWTEHLNELGFPEADIVAAHSLLPATNCLMQGPDIVLGRIGRRTFTLDSAIGTDVLRGLSETASDLKIYGDTLARSLDHASSGSALTHDNDLLIWLSNQHSQSSGALSLRQGAHQTRRPVDLKGIGQWRLAGILAAVLSLGWFVTTLIQTQAMQARTAELDRLSTEFATAGWPETNGDIQRALALSGAQRGGGSALPSALTTVSVLYEALATIPAAELRSLRYDASRGQLSAIIAFEGFADADQLASAVETRGLSAIAGDARQSGGKVVGDFIIGAGA
jgi:general secretion pathway protein L